MYATLLEKPFDSSEWLFEIKWDGYRVIAEVDKDSVVLYSRNDKNLNSYFYEIADSLGKMQIRAVFDGEIVAVDSQGISRFQLLQKYIKNKKGNLVYYIFDILYIEGYELLNLHLLARKELLKEILYSDAGKTLKNIKYSDHITSKGIAFFNAAVDSGLEGIIAKKAASKYIPGARSRQWLKIKTRLRQEVIICGYTEPRGSRQKIGAIITGAYDNGELVFTGQVGSGLDEEELENLFKMFQNLKTGKPPFKTFPKTSITARWLKPVLVAEVEFAEWTEEGMMRQPVYMGLRIDKDPAEVNIERPSTIAGNRHEIKQSKQSEFNAGHIILNNPEKIFWPEEKYTKRDLFEYYKNISGFILPYIINRPQSLNRCPDGIGGECFYQKDVDYELPPGLYTKKIFSESKNDYIDYLVCAGLESLLYMVNLGCIDIHPWNSRIEQLEYPDYAILDLDPLDVDFTDVIKTALETKKVLDELSVEGFCKTSGSKGIHIYLPLNAKYSYDIVLDFMKLIARLINSKLPEITSLERSPEKRRNRVYLDCYQNRIGQTVAAPYCIRPRKGAPVSTPLLWEELGRPFKPADFDMRNIFSRLEKIGDIWEKVLGKGIDLEKALERIEKH